MSERETKATEDREFSLAGVTASPLWTGVRDKARGFFQCLESTVCQLVLFRNVILTFSIAFSDFFLHCRKIHHRFPELQKRSGFGGVPFVPSPVGCEPIETCTGVS